MFLSKPCRQSRAYSRFTLRAVCCDFGVLTTAYVVLSSAAAIAQSGGNDSQQQEIDALKARVDQLESQSALPTASEPPPRVATAVSGGELLTDAVPGAERAIGTTSSPEPAVTIGGALRFNFVHRDFVSASKDKRGESGLDVFRLNVEGASNDILISAEYRFYSYMHTIHHGWLGYEFDDGSQLQAGISQVPFGLLPYAAHNAWFGVPYYLGLADNYDMGIKYVSGDGPWQWQLAFYKNEELNDATNLNRYAFDVVRVGEQQNEKINQINARTTYTFGEGSGCETELGGSGQVAQLYDASTQERGDHWAGAAHLDSRCGRWNFQVQAVRYRYDPYRSANASGNASNVSVGAFAASFPIASSADIGVANIAYNFDSPWPRVEQIICYNDYSRLFKNTAGAIDSQVNTTGCAVGSGPIFAYFDYITANNMAFFGQGSMAAGGEDAWHGRFNVNLGYYW